MRYIASLFISLIFFMSPAFAQEQDPENDPQSEEENGDYKESVIVYGKFDPRVSDAFKIRKNPDMEKIEVEKEDVNYEIQSVRLPVSFELDPIRPARMVGDPLDKLYNNHLRLAMGTSTMPYLEYFYNSTRSRDNAFGIHLKHFSASGKLDGHPFPGFSDNLAEVYNKRFFKNHILTTSVGYERNVVHSYGIPTEIYDTLSRDIGKDDIRLLYNRITASVGFNSDYSSYDDDKFHHSFGLDFYYFTDNADNSELNLEFTGDIYKEVNLLKAAEEQYLGLKIGADYLNNKWDTLNGVYSGIYSVTPYLENSFKNIDLTAGVNIFIDSDSTSSRIKFYPDVHLKMELIKNIFVLKGGISGNTSGDYMYGLTRENPFLKGFVPLQFRYHKSILYAGLNASISKNIDFAGYFEADNVQNAPFFLKDTTTELANRFNLVHDSIRSIRIKAELQYHLQEKLDIMLGAEYTEYTLTRLKEAWNKPAIEGYLKARYDLQEKIIVTGELFFIGERKALGIKDGVFQTVTLDPVIDANISAEYRYNKLLSGFVSFHNLAGGKYQRWSSYPTYGFQFMAGLTYSM